MIRKYFRYLFYALVQTNLIKYIHFLGLQVSFSFLLKLNVGLDFLEKVIRLLILLCSIGLLRGVSLPLGILYLTTIYKLYIMIYTGEFEVVMR